MIDLAPYVEPLAPSAQRIIDAFELCPAYVVGRRGDVLEWNEATEAVYRCHLIPPLYRNIYLFVFSQPDARKLIVNWEDQARRRVKELREALAKDPQDVILMNLRRRLEASPDFRALWRAKATVLPDSTIFLHPRVGRLEFELQTLQLEGRPGFSVRLYLPLGGAGTDARMQRLLRMHRRDVRSRKGREIRAAVRKAKDQIDTDYSRDLPLEDLAALAGMNKYLFLRAFASETGYPPHAYQLLVRIFHARRLLALGQGAAEVALTVGFTDQSHLIRHFRRLEGMTPAQFVRRYPG